jgi:hypothetical protein
MLPAELNILTKAAAESLASASCDQSLPFIGCAGSDEILLTHAEFRMFTIRPNCRSARASPGAEIVSQPGNVAVLWSGVVPA